jgi:ribonuclease VapC
VIVVDTSALIAIILDEPASGQCMDALEGDDRASMSAGTLAEALLVAGRRNKGPEMQQLIDGLAIEIVNLTSSGARNVAAARGQWGRGSATSALNFGDCFAYALAKERSCPLLFVGEDFSRTDIASVL